MSYFLKNIDFLKYFLFWKIILHVGFIYCLYSYLLSCEFMNTQSNPTESSFTYEFHTFIELKRSFWNWFILFYICLVISNNLFSFLNKLTIKLELAILSILIIRNGKFLALYLWLFNLSIAHFWIRSHVWILSFLFCTSNSSLTHNCLLVLICLFTLLYLGFLKLGMALNNLAIWSSSTTNILRIQINVLNFLIFLITK